MLTANAMLQPVVALVLWSMVMWLWMYVTRIPAIQASRMKLDRELPNGQQMSTLPARVRWKADNYNHLMEQPTIFYAAALVLAVVGDASQVSLGLAWAYVGLRVAHSVFQATVNKIEVRFAIFALSSLVMAALAVRAAMQVF